jgi:hypothetical protein
MSFDSLLSFASRIEAAVASYLEVRDFTDEAKWRAKFDTERVRILTRVCCRVSISPPVVKEKCRLRV